MENFYRDNTEVFYTPGLVEMELFGNVIAKYWISEGVIELLDGGHKTNTTKERLNGILKELNRGHIYQLNWNWYYKDEYGKVRPFGKGIARSLIH